MNIKRFLLLLLILSLITTIAGCSSNNKPTAMQALNAMQTDANSIAGTAGVITIERVEINSCNKIQERLQPGPTLSKWVYNCSVTVKVNWLGRGERTGKTHVNLLKQAAGSWVVYHKN